MRKHLLILLMALVVFGCSEHNNTKRSRRAALAQRDAAFSILNTATIEGADEGTIVAATGLVNTSFNARINGSFPQGTLLSIDLDPTASDNLNPLVLPLANRETVLNVTIPAIAMAGNYDLVVLNNQDVELARLAGAVVITDPAPAPTSDLEGICPTVGFTDRSTPIKVFGRFQVGDEIKLVTTANSFDANNPNTFVDVALDSQITPETLSVTGAIPPLPSAFSTENTELSLVIVNGSTIRSTLDATVAGNDGFTYIPRDPVIDGFTPTSVIAGNNLTVFGNFPASSSVILGNTVPPGQTNNTDPATGRLTSITFQVPALTGNPSAAVISIAWTSQGVQLDRSFRTPLVFGANNPGPTTSPDLDIVIDTVTSVTGGLAISYTFRRNTAFGNNSPTVDSVSIQILNGANVLATISSSITNPISRVVQVAGTPANLTYRVTGNPGSLNPISFNDVFINIPSIGSGSTTPLTRN